VKFTEEWFDDDAQSTLAELGRSVAHVPGRIVEVGAWEGRSTVALANAVAPREMHSVDTWRGSPSDQSWDLASVRDVFGTWQANIEELTAGNVVAYRMDWREYVAVAEGPVALCFIDADHTYDEVFDNIVAILPVLSRGGVLCGDDISALDVLAAVSDTVGYHYRAGTLWYWRKP